MNRAFNNKECYFNELRYCMYSLSFIWTLQFKTSKNRTDSSFSYIFKSIPYIFAKSPI